MNSGGTFVYVLMRKTPEGNEAPNIGYLDEDAAIRKAGNQYQVKSVWIPHKESYS